MIDGNSGGRSANPASNGGARMDQSSSAKAAGRRAGLVYLILAIFTTGGYATTTWLLGGDPQTVLGRLAARHALFTLGVAASVIGFGAWIVLAFMLYRLMSSSGRFLGLLMVIFTVSGVAMNWIALSHLLPLVTSASSGMDPGTLAPIVGSYNRVLLLAQVFSGLWLLPFGWLVVRSRIAPQVLGFCLFIGGFSYLLLFVTAFNPSLNHITAYRIISTALVVPAMIGELGMCLWLLIKGASEPGLAPRGVPQTA